MNSIVLLRCCFGYVVGTVIEFKFSDVMGGYGVIATLVAS